MMASAPLIIVAGPPASGKGTQCKLLAQSYGFTHVSIGDMCREQAKRSSLVGLQIKDFMERGDLVPDDLIVRVLEDCLGQLHTSKGCLLDGFPRTAKQAKTLFDRVVPTAFVHLYVPDDTIVERALGRRNDPVTGAIYHVISSPPPAAIAFRLVRRDNDVNETVVRKRLEVYHAQANEVRSCFAGRVQIHDVDGSRSAGEVFKTIANALLPFLSTPSAIATTEEDDWGDEPDASMEPTMQLMLEAAPTENLENGCETMVAVRICVPENAEGNIDGKASLHRTASGRVSRAPADVCCVVDISGSMGTKATYEVDGVMKDDGLIYLDIVKHAVKTVTHILQDQDRFALIAFDEEAHTCFPLEFMTSEGRVQAVHALESLSPRGATNIWGGLLAGMEALRKPAADDDRFRQKTILLLTDGQPNRNPPKGHIQELKDYKETNTGFSFQLNTFGFGYNLDSKLLLDLAVEGQGTFSFIPDAVIVGTCFVNSVSNLLSTQTQNAMLHLTPKGGAEFSGRVLGVGNDLVAETSWGRVVHLGPLTFGQSRDTVVPMRIPAGEAPYLEAVVVYPTDRSGGTGKAFVQASRRTSTAWAVTAFARSSAVATGYEVIAKGENGSGAEKAREDVLALGERTCLQGTEECVVALRADVQGRMAKALDGQDRFRRWGRHYLRALTRAHQLQLCTNFMDTGLQCYGGELFRALRDEGDKVFVSLPARTPSARPSSSAAARGVKRSRSKSPDMQTYYAGSGGG
jgi:adenylate kinase